jgi:hypothetical protein
MFTAILSAFRPTDAGSQPRVNRPGGADLWLLDLERGSTGRFTSASALNVYPVWSPDARTIVFNTAASEVVSQGRRGIW